MQCEQSNTMLLNKGFSSKCTDYRIRGRKALKEQRIVQQKKQNDNFSPEKFGQRLCLEFFCKHFMNLMLQFVPTRRFLLRMFLTLSWLLKWWIVLTGSYVDYKLKKKKWMKNLNRTHTHIYILLAYNVRKLRLFIALQSCPLLSFFTIFHNKKMV